MSITISQANRPIQAKTPLGPDVLIPVSLEGEEEVSRPFRFSVDFVSQNLAVSASALLGKPIGLKIALPEGGTRLIHGVVRRFASLGVRRELARYRAEIVPQLWFLSLGNETRTFETKSIPEILDAVCHDAGVVERSLRIVGSYKPVDYVAQYRESHLDFVSRLMEEAGLYYMFEHEEDKHTLVISDAHGGSIPAGGLPTVKVGLSNPGDEPELDTITELAREYAVHSGKVAYTDHDLLRADSVGEAQSSNPGATGRRHDFLGDLGPNDSATEARRMIELEEAEHDQLVGSSTVAAFTAGTRVKLTGGILGAGGVEVHILKVRHQLQIGDLLAGGNFEASYSNNFRAIDAAVKFRPERRTARPSVHGTQTAKVVGSGSVGDIDVDEHGRVLLQFPWDRGKGKDGRSKHRVHVASAWAGAGWGFVQLPRIGQEVLVEFLEGDPDRPIVTGRVYNSSNKAPYGLPANKTQSGWKSRTVGGGADNFNELRFEDKSGEEHVFLHAEKDLQVKVKNDETRNVLHDRTTTIKNKDTRTVEEGDDKHTIKKGKHEFIVTEGDHVLEVNKGQQTIKIKSNQKVTIEDGNRTVTLQSGNDKLEVKQGNLEMIIMTGKVLINAPKITLDATQAIEFKCGGSTMSLKPAAIEMKSVQVKVAGDAAVEVKAAQLKMEGQAQAELKGAMVKVEGQAMTTIKGAIAQVTGDGMLKAGGGITMLG